MTQPVRLSPDSLLAHEPFVRAVVRDLLRDEHRAQDVVQETWIRALAKGPRESGSLKGWLASVARRLAIDERRGSARRERRELETARGEALESVDALHARLEAQREVVDAVLALEEPYKSVVLLAYYEQLAPQAIAERLGRSAATVRSQLSRAHEVLKRRLDAHHGGDRSAWAGVLLPWALATKSKAGVLVAAGLGVALLGAGAWILPRLSADPVGGSGSIAMEIPASEPAAPGELLATAPSSTRESMPTSFDPQSTSASQKPDLSKLKADELRDLAVQAMRTLERKLLTPDARFLGEQSSLLALPDTGLAKLTMRTSNEFPYASLILPRGGGSYFSFATLSHDYDWEPDIEYENGRLKSGFYGAAVGMVLPVGDLDLANLEYHRRPEWEHLYVLPESDDISGARKLQDLVRERLGNAAAEVGTTYLVRNWSPEEHDHLVGMRILEKDSESMTIAWRILQRFPHAAPKREGFKALAWNSVPAAPDWIESLEKQSLVELIHEIRKHAEALLLGIPERLREENAWRTKGVAEAGFFRLLVRERYIPAVEAPWGASKYSIEKREYTESNPHVEYNIDTLDADFLFDLARLDSAEYQGVVSGQCPARLTGKAREAWAFLWSTASVYTGGGGTRDRGLPDEDQKRFQNLVNAPNSPVPGHSFLMRSIDSDADTDRLVLLTVLETTSDGTTLCWRELKRFDR